jgi:hypothetical protein
MEWRTCEKGQVRRISYPVMVRKHGKHRACQCDMRTQILPGCALRMLLCVNNELSCDMLRGEGGFE